MESNLEGKAMVMKRIVKWVSMLIGLLVLPATVLAWPVPDTGQTTCYDAAGNVIPCPQPGEAFYGQDGNYTINPPSYTKLDASGNDLPESAASWVMVRDNVTGLIWEVKQNKDDVKNYANPHDADNEYTWYDSNPETNGGDAGTPGDGTDTEDFIAALNTANFGGHSDWRLPTRQELRSIVNYSRVDPSIDTALFPNVVSSYYWSSTTYTYAAGTGNAWGMYFNSGYDDYGAKSNSYCVRAVRGGQTQNRFVDNGDGTVTDASTGLMWQQATAPGTYTWQQALSYCEGLSLAGHTDWRLSTIKELESIVNLARYNPSIDTAFPDTQSSYYWSPTTAASCTGVAWGMNFYSGNVYGNYKSNSYCVRAVRGGQSGSLLPAAPTANAATSITTSGFQANWSSVSGATGYRLDVSTSSAFSSFVSGYNNLDVGNSTSRSVSGLSSGTTYYYRVRAYNASGTGGNSNIISATTSEDNRIKGNLPFLPLLLE